MLNEHERAKIESAMNYESELYFNARPKLNNVNNLRIFEAGFKIAWEIKTHWQELPEDLA